MVLLLDTEVDTPPDPTTWESAAATAVFLTSSQSKPEDTATSLPSGQSEGMIYM